MSVAKRKPSLLNQLQTMANARTAANRHGLIFLIVRGINDRQKTCVYSSSSSVVGNLIVAAGRSRKSFLQLRGSYHVVQHVPSLGNRGKNWLSLRHDPC